MNTYGFCTLAFDRVLHDPVKTELVPEAAPDWKEYLGD